MTVIHASTGDLGHRGPSFAGVTNPPTAEKPQSKLWFHDGTWWAVMYDPATGDWRIHGLDRTTDTWVSTGVRVDPRKQTLSDVLWDGTKLYVASHWVTTSTDGVTRVSVAKPARLYRYGYDAGARTYVPDPGFPSEITPWSSEALTIDRDTTGRLWATWTVVTGSSTSGYSAQVEYASSADGTTWTTPQPMPTPAAAVAPDDVSAVVSFGRSSIGVLWSNQRDDTVYWGVHRDGTPLDVWTTGPAVRGPKQPDDHINLKSLQSDEHGRVWAAVKTSLDGLPGAPPSSPQVELLHFKPATGSWSRTTVGTIADCHTRPIVVLDEENSLVHVFATAPVSDDCAYSGAPGAIYQKTAPMTDPVFTPGRGTPVIRDSTSPYVNNASASKQPVTSRTGLVILASDTKTGQYWHADLEVPATATPTSEPTPEPTSEPTPEPTPEPAPTVERRAVSTVVTPAAATSIAVEKPAGTVEGDLLVSCLALDGGRVTSNGAPDGWSLISAGDGIRNPKVYGYYKIAGSDEPQAYRWTLGSAVLSSGGIARYVGAVGLDSAVSVGSGPSATSATVQGVTTSTPGAMLVGCMAINSGALSIAMHPAASMTEAWNLGGKRQEYADEVIASPGGTGTRTWSFSAGREWSGWLTSLRPGH